MKSLPRIALIGAMALIASTAHAAQDPEALRQEFFAAYTAKEWPKAIEIGTQLAALQPPSPVDLYNLACVYALSGDKPKAMEALQRAVEQKLDDVNLVRTDSDLASLRSEPGWEKIIEGVKQNAKPRMESLERLAASSEPVIVAPEGIDTNQPAPIIVALHGAGGKAEQIVEAWRDVAAKHKAILVAPRAVRAASQDGFQWGTPDEADYLVQRALEHAAKSHKIDRKQIVITGFSQGGNMAFQIGMKHPEQFAGIITVAGNLGLALPTLAPGQGQKLPRTIMLVGRQDSALNSNQQFSKHLEKAGAKCRLVVYEEVAHEFPKDRDAELAKALEFALGK